MKTAPTFAEIRTSLRSPLLGRLILTQFAFAIAFTSWVTVFALWGERVLGFGPQQTAFVFIVSSVVGIIMQLGFIGPLVDRFGEGRIALAGLLVAFVAYAGVGFITAPLAVYAFIVLWSMGGALIRPSLGTLISGAAPPGQRGTILSVNDSLNNLAFFVAPFVSTAVLRFNPHLTGIAPAAFTCIALGIGYRVMSGPRSPEESAAKAA